MRFIYHYDLAAFLISLVILYNVFLKQRISTRVLKSFKVLAIDLFIAIIFDLITIFTISYYEHVSVWLNTILNIIALITYNLLPVFYLISIIFATAEEDEVISKKSLRLACIPSVIGMLMIITTPITIAIKLVKCDASITINIPSTINNIASSNSNTLLIIPPIYLEYIMYGINSKVY